MVPAPRTVLSGWLHNTFRNPVHVKVIYANLGGSKPHREETTFDVAPGSRVKIPERTYQDGLATFSMPIDHIRVQDIMHQNRIQAELHAPFNVRSPTRDHEFTVGDDMTLRD